MWTNNRHNFETLFCLWQCLFNFLFLCHLFQSNCWTKKNWWRTWKRRRFFFTCHGCHRRRFVNEQFEFCVAWKADRFTTWKIDCVGFKDITYSMWKSKRKRIGTFDRTEFAVPSNNWKPIFIIFGHCSCSERQSADRHSFEEQNEMCNGNDDNNKAVAFCGIANDQNNSDICKIFVCFHSLFSGFFIVQCLTAFYCKNTCTFIDQNENSEFLILSIFRQLSAMNEWV